MTKFYSINFTSASAGASIPQAQQHTSKNNTNSTNCNKNGTDLLSIIGKQESNKPGNPSVSPTIDNHNKMISNEQKTLDNSMTSMSRTITHDDRIISLLIHCFHIFFVETKYLNHLEGK